VLVSVVLFGSAATGGFSSGVSDVDAIIVLADGATRDDRKRLLHDVSLLEVSHGLRAPPGRAKTALERFAERTGGHGLSSFVCTRADLLSGDIAKILGLRRVETLLVDRIVLASIVASAMTVWGEDVLLQVRVPPVRRLDVMKAFFAFANQALLAIVAFPVLPEATRYAMGTLKRSLHSCFFCFERRGASLEEEIAFFDRGRGQDRTLAELLALRRQYRRSFSFVLRCLPTLARLHWRAACDNEFPLAPRLLPR
jgi:Nucleotidyltransferase domain